METTTEMETDKLICSNPANSPGLRLWLVDELTILAEALGESGEKVSPERLRIYAGDLADLDQRQLEIAFRRARRELKFFPKISELRELAGVPKQEQCNEAEAYSAFQAVIRHLKRNGIDAGVRSLTWRLQYAVRQCGGLATFNNRLADKTFPFLQRDFCEAYARAPIAEITSAQLSSSLGLKQLADRESFAGRVERE
jgi:hypothetical protein